MSQIYNICRDASCHLERRLADAKKRPIASNPPACCRNEELEDRIQNEETSGEQKKQAEA